MYIVEFVVIFASIVYLQKIKINLAFSLTCCLIGIVTVGAFYFLDPLMTIIVFFGSIIIALLFYSTLFKICLDLSLIIFIGMISDHIAQIIKGENINVFLHSLLFLICYLTLFFGFTFILQYFKRPNNLSFSTITKLLISILSCITIIVLYLNIFIPTTYEEIQLTKINLIIQISYLVIMSILITLLVNNINRASKVKHEKMEQSLFKQYMSSLEEINLNMQKFRHDYKNILITMERYIESGDLEKLKNYFQDKIIKTEKNTLLKNTLIKDLGNLEIIELKGLLLTKLFLAVEENLNIQIEIPEKIKRIPMDIIDLSRIVGILIDNAIEASVQSPNPFVNLAIIITSKNSTLIIIENSFNDSSLDISQIYKTNYSTKKGNRGFGLKNIANILSNYPNILLNISIENYVFIQEIEILDKR